MSIGDTEEYGLIQGNTSTGGTSLLSVLVIGDNKLLKNAQSILGGTGNEIRYTLFKTTEDAVSEIISHSYDLLISDWSTGQESLVQLIEKMHSSGGYEPLLMITGPMKEGSEPGELSEFAFPADTKSGEKARELFARLGSRISLALEKTVPAEREKKHQARLCSILASINTGVFIVDRRTHIILNANEYALKLLQGTKEEIVGRDYRVSLSLANSMIQVETLSEEAVLQSEGELVDTTGRIIPVIVNVTPVKISTDHDLLITFLDNSVPKMAEKALIESEMKFGILVDTSPDAILLTDLEGTILKANSNALGLFGFPREEDIRKSLLRDLIHAEDPSVVRHFLGDLIATGSTRKECTGYSQMRTRIPLEISSSLIRNSDGRPFSLIHVIRDLTCQKKAEELLKASEERYRNVVEDQTEFICRFKPDGTHVFVNGAYCRYFGKPREDIIGSRFIPHIHADDRAGLLKHFASLTPDHPVALISHRIIMPDGEIRWQRWSDRAIYDEEGRLSEYQSVGRDITERKKAEEALKTSEERYRTIFENTGTAMVIIKEDTTIGFANNEFFRLTGYSRDDIDSRKSWTEFVHKDDRNLMIEQHQIRRTCSGDALRQYEFRLLTKSGEIRNILLTIEMFPGTTRSIASLIDITDRKQVAEALHDRVGRLKTLSGKSDERTSTH
jgi:PAS domain S-box-containing protein